jgi:putative oxidoreductase
LIDGVALVGRVLLSLIFVWDGWGKLTNAAATQALIAKSGLPLPGLAYPVSVLVEFGVGLALLVGFLSRLSGLTLAAWCLVLAAVFHASAGDRMQEIQFMKNLSMAGGMLFVAAHGGGAFSLDALLGRRRRTLAAA